MKFLMLPRIRLAHLPTPLQELMNLRQVLNGPRLFVKRDDLTGLALGGNKTRKLEYLMVDALHHGANYIVTGAGFQSNWCTQAAAAARKVGMKVVLIKKGPSDDYEPEEHDGNHLIHFLQGTEIKVVRPEKYSEAVESVIEDLKAKGHRPYFLSNAGSTPLGVAGYVHCMLELFKQAVELGLNIDYLVHTTGSGGTQAGLVIGSKAFNTGIKIISASTGSRTSATQSDSVSSLIDQSLEFLELDLKFTNEDIVVHDQYSGGGYGFMSKDKADAIRLLAETEGIMLDPVYTAASMALLIDMCRKKRFKTDDVVVFLHTGGFAGLFPYRKPLEEYASGRDPSWTVPPWSPLSHSREARDS
jgi:L-cysteate sulfo-lyase